MPLLSLLYIGWIGVLSLVTVVLYGWDKRRAGRGGRRVPEMTLHLMSLAGGFPGGWAGRMLFRHKTRKLSFAIILTLSSLLHGVLLWRATG